MAEHTRKDADVNDDSETPRPWIETVSEADAEGELAALYAQVSDPPRGPVDNIMKIHSLDPGGLAGHLAVYRSAMRSTPSLPRVERELIAVVVSGINGCHY
jgi:alkylhydroperoxidase family enzyme